MNHYKLLALMAFGRVLVALATIAAIVLLVRDGHPVWAVLMIATGISLIDLLNVNVSTQAGGDS